MRMTEQERRIRIRHLKRMYRIRERKERHDKKVSGLFMKRVVFTLILAAFIFTVVMIFVFLRMGSEPSTLIENVFRFLSVEGGAMALIKSVKTVKGTKSNGEIQHNDEPEQDDEGGYAVYVFVKMPSDKQLNKVREWLLYAVTKAEKELGGGTGQIKLRYVYDMFVARFAWLARVISFEAFSMMVDEALERMKKMLESNKAMQTLVSGEAGEVNE